MKPKAMTPESEMTEKDAYYELEGALTDLRREGADPICIRTIERVQGWIKDLEAAAYARGKAEGLEEAAKIVEGGWTPTNADRFGTAAKRLAGLIRSRIKQGIGE